MTTSLRVLILEDRAADAELMVHELRRAGFSLEWRRVETEADYLAHLDPAPDVILADYTLPQFDAPRALAIVEGRGLDIPVIVVTGSINEELAVESMKRGAADYLLKDRLTRLGAAVTQALEQKKLRDTRRRNEARIHHLNDVLRAISGVNQLLVRERNPLRLLTGVCGTLLQTRGYRLVWIGYVNADHKRVVPVARAGEVDVLDDVLVTWDEGPTGQGPTGVAIRTRRPAFCQDIIGDPRSAPWRDLAQARGYASAAAVPLFHGERVLGALSVYADRPQAFDEEEISLLSELGDDLTLALRSIENEQERKRAEREIKSAARFPAESPDPILRLSHDGTILYANEASGPLLRHWASDVGGPAPASWCELVRESLGSRSRRSFDIERDGLVYSIVMTPFPDAGYVNAYARDIAERKHAEAALAEHVTQLEAVRAISVEIARELDLTVLLRLIVERVTRLVGTTLGTCFLWDETEQYLRPQAWIGYEDWRAETRLRLGEGLGGQAAQRREGLFTNDYPAEPYADPHVLVRKPIRASIAEPLLYRDRLIGVLTLDHDVPGAIFTAREQQLLRLFAAQAAIAIETARLFTVADRGAREARSLYDIAHSLSTSLDVTEVLQLIVAKTTALLETPHGQVVLWDEATNSLRLGAAYGTKVERVKHQEFQLGVGVNGLVAQSRAPLVVNDYQTWPHRVPELTDVVAVIGVPLLYRDRLVGILTTIATTPDSMFTERHLVLLKSFADQAAIALENARLYEQVRLAAAELEARVEARTAELADANRQLQAASHHKSEFLANMSHELRTPLNSILGFSQLLLEQTSNVLPEKQRRFLSHIYTSGQHLLQLINDILDLSKVEAGKLVLYPEPVALPKLVEETLVIVRGLANKKELRIEATVPAELPRLVVDPIRLKQILFNLLSNAVKFTPERGTITVTAHIVPPSAIRNPQSAIGDFLEIAVTDTGVGIKAEDLPRLFHDFVQLEATATKRHEGTGLGLSLTKQLVELHGGRIWAQSAGLGRGACFVVQLPLLEIPALSILVVDDEAPFRRLLAMILGEAGYRVHVAQDVPEAIRAVDADPPALVVLDVGLPPDNAGGWTVLAHLRSTAGLCSMPVLILTGQDQIHAEEALARGASEFLGKPVSPHVLEETVARLLRSSASIETRTDP